LMLRLLFYTCRWQWWRGWWSCDPGHTPWHAHPAAPPTRATGHCSAGELGSHWSVAIILHSCW